MRLDVHFCQNRQLVQLDFCIHDHELPDSIQEICELKPFEKVKVKMGIWKKKRQFYESDYGQFPGPQEIKLV